MRQSGRSVGHPTYMEDSCLCKRSISGPRLKERIRLSVGSGFVRLEAVCIAQYQGRIQRSVGRREGFTPSENPALFRRPWQPSSSPHVRGFRF